MLRKKPYDSTLMVRPLDINNWPIRNQINLTSISAFKIGKKTKFGVEVMRHQDQKDIFFMIFFLVCTTSSCWKKWRNLYSKNHKKILLRKNYLPCILFSFFLFYYFAVFCFASNRINYFTWHVSLNKKRQGNKTRNDSFVSHCACVCILGWLKINFFPEKLTSLHDGGWSLRY